MKTANKYGTLLETGLVGQKPRVQFIVLWGYEEVEVMIMEEMITPNRRKYPRIPISFPVECDILSPANYFYTVSRDLSAAGIKILSNRFFSKDNLLKVSINFVDRVMQLKARVAWCAQSRSPDTYVAGLEFVEIPAHEQKILAHFLEKIQTPA